ncbi:MAG: hypothetical protein ACT4P4_22595 [Betaproteobacteria bacterium]
MTVYFTDRDLGKRFPEVLTAGGLAVQRHADHFAHDTDDEVWLETVGQSGWVTITHDTRIRYKPNELAAVARHKVRLIVIIGAAPFPELAKHFVDTAPKIENYIAATPAPWIAKVYRPSLKELAGDPDAPGSIKHWYP